MAGRGAQTPSRGRQGALLGLVLLNALILTVALTALPAIRAPHPLERGRSLALTSARADVPSFSTPTFAPVLPAPPSSPVAPSSPARAAPTPHLTRQQVSDAALALIHYPWRELGVHISFLGPRGGYLGRTFPQEGRIEM